MRLRNCCEVDIHLKHMVVLSYRLYRNGSTNELRQESVDGAKLIPLGKPNRAEFEGFLKTHPPCSMTAEELLSAFDALDLFGSITFTAQAAD
jgi:hypothetical protein